MVILNSFIKLKGVVRDWCAALPDDMAQYAGCSKAALQPGPPEEKEEGHLTSTHPSPSPQFVSFWFAHLFHRKCSELIGTRTKIGLKSIRRSNIIPPTIFLGNSKSEH